MLVCIPLRETTPKHSLIETVWRILLGDTPELQRMPALRPRSLPAPLRRLHLRISNSPISPKRLDFFRIKATVFMITSKLLKTV